ncbi:extracellular solute-binding protein [Paenibacillus antri]|uniref:extracellular solute-binding protein n=1 Tax=Paenibacillus antri TaxID=2582848 RepID=UPI001EE48632|nr:extracellular solute-binding protein [Paenibacillus antri]
MKRTNSFEDRYNRLLQELRNEILTGGLRPGEFILPENTLSEKYEISRVSVRKVLAALVDEGLIEKIAGKGNRVRIPGEDIRRETLTVAWFSTSYEIDIIRKLIAMYEESHPYVRVELLLLPETEYVDNIVNLIEYGFGPDVFILSELHIRHLIEKDRLDLLMPYVPERIDVERDSYRKVFDMFAVGGEVVATPFVFSPVVICYNERLLSDGAADRLESMDDWSDLLALAERSTVKREGSDIIDRYGFCFSASPNRWPVFLLQNDGRFIEEGGTASVLSETNNVEALQFCADLMYKYKVSPIYSHGSSYLAESLFKKERVAMILTTYYFMNEFRGHDLRWDVLPLPSRKKQGTLLLGGGLAINRQTNLPEMAKHFIDFLTDKPAQTMLKQQGCTIPMLREVAEDNRLLDPDIHPECYNVFLEALPHASSLRDLSLRQSEVELVQKELNLLWANMETPEDACRRIEALLNERRAEAAASSAAAKT